MNQISQHAVLSPLEYLVTVASHEDIWSLYGHPLSTSITVEHAYIVVVNRQEKCQECQCGIKSQR